MRICAFAAALLLAPACSASSPAAWAAHERAARAACTRAAGLAMPTASPLLLFGDASAKSALLVSGRWPQPHMKGRRGTMLCLYDRRTKSAEVVEATGWQAPLLP